MLTCVINSRDILVLGGIHLFGGKRILYDGFILDHQTAEVSKLFSTGLAIVSDGNSCHASLDGTINAVIYDQQNVKLV